MSCMSFEEQSITISACSVAVAVVFFQKFFCSCLVDFANFAVAGIYGCEHLQMRENPPLHHISPDIPSVFCDDQRIFLVAGNHLLNAFLYVPGSGFCLFPVCSRCRQRKNESHFPALGNICGQEFKTVAHAGRTAESFFCQEAAYLIVELRHRLQIYQQFICICSKKFIFAELCRLAGPKM